MTPGPTAWRANDSVQYETAREVANGATANLLGLAGTGSIDLPTALAEATTIRRALLSVDGFDRQSVDDFIRRLEARVAELKEFRR
jgi:hypothetical protein